MAKNQILWRRFNDVRAAIGAPVVDDPMLFTCPKCGSIEFIAPIKLIEYGTHIVNMYKECESADLLEELDVEYSNHEFRSDTFVCYECETAYTRFGGEVVIG